MTAQGPDRSFVKRQAAWKVLRSFLFGFRSLLEGEIYPSRWKQ
jgi:hypothetical protein